MEYYKVNTPMRQAPKSISRPAPHTTEAASGPCTPQGLLSSQLVSLSLSSKPLD